MDIDDRNEIFILRARRCKRCGGILTSAQAIKDGYGHTCKMKAAIEKANQLLMKDQISFFTDDEKEEE